MKTVIIDNENLALGEIAKHLGKSDAQILATFTSPHEGYEFVLVNQPEAVVINISFPTISGLELGEKIRACLPSTTIIYATNFSQKPLEALKGKSLDFVLMPVERHRIDGTLRTISSLLNHEIDDVSAFPKIKCFGHFSFVQDHVEIKFSTQKARELLAYLICHYRQPIFKENLMRMLFESEDKKKTANNFRVTMFRLRQTLSEANIKKQHLLIGHDGSISIFEGICDLVDFVNFVSTNKTVDETNVIEAQKIIDSIDGQLFSDIDTYWVMDLREFIAIQVEDLVLKTAQYYISNKIKLKTAEKLLINLLRNNELSEHGFMLLLDLYITTENMEKFIYLYRRYAKILKVDLDSVPDRKYTEYYIINNK